MVENGVTASQEHETPKEGEAVHPSPATNVPAIGNLIDISTSTPVSQTRIEPVDRPYSLPDVSSAPCPDASMSMGPATYDDRGNQSTPASASQANDYNIEQPQRLGFLQTDYEHSRPGWEMNDPSGFLSPPEEYQRHTEGCNSSSYQYDSSNLGHIQGTDDGPQTCPQLGAWDWNIFKASRIDWVSCETDVSDRQTLPPDDLPSERLSTHTCMHQRRNESISENGSITSTPSSHGFSKVFHPRYPVDIPEITDVDGTETWPGILDKGGNETWPFDYTSNKGFRKIRLPPLRQILEQTVGDRPAIEKTTLMDLIKVLSAPYIPSLNDSPALEALPAVLFLNQFVKIFFAEFHTVLPVLHMPTWRIEKCPTALLAAVACIGATYSTAEGSSEVSALLAEITQRALFWMV